MEYEVKRETKTTSDVSIRFAGENGTAVYVRNTGYMTIVSKEPFYTVTVPVEQLAALGALFATMEVALRELPPEVRAELKLEEKE